MSAFAAALPKVRRIRRPPKRVVYRAAVLLLDFGWLARIVIDLPHHPPFDALFALVFVCFAVRDHAALRETVRWWLAGRAVPAPSRFEWAMLTGGTAFLIFAAITL